MACVIRELFRVNNELENDVWDIHFFYALISYGTYIFLKVKQDAWDIEIF